MRPPLIFSIDASRPLSQNLCRHLSAEKGKFQARSFPDGETYLRVISSCSGRHVILLAELSFPDPKIAKLLFLAETLQEQNARSVGLVAPYLPYMRQDKAFRKGEAITSKIFARLLSQRFNWLITVDPHLHRYRSLSQVYSIPAKAVSSASSIAQWIRKRTRNPLLVGPDEESKQWIAAIAKEASAPFVVFHKIRKSDRKVTISAPRLGSWKDRSPIVIDDIISTGHTMVETVRHLRRASLQRPICIGVHALFAEGSEKALLASGAGRVLTTNTIPHPTNRIDISKDLADAIRSEIKAATSLKA